MSNNDIASMLFERQPLGLYPCSSLSLEPGSRPTWFVILGLMLSLVVIGLHLWKHAKASVGSHAPAIPAHDKDKTLAGKPCGGDGVVMPELERTPSSEDAEGLRSPFASMVAAPSPELKSTPPSVGHDTEIEYAAGCEEGTVSYPDGSKYCGELLNNLPDGRGVLTWKNGDRYEGEFRMGVQEGQGTMVAADGSLYFGGWDGGQVHGRGVYKPACKVDGSTQDDDHHARRNITTASGESQASPIVAFFRDYSHGRLKGEIPLHAQGQEAGRKSDAKKARKAAIADAAPVPARPLAPGEVIFKGHRSYDLMRQLQLGIMYSIAQRGFLNGNTPKDRSSVKKDIANVEIQYFPSDTGVFGGDLPAFKWKNYAPRSFHRLRRLFGIDPADYLVSLTGGPALRELSSPGASGAIFFLSEDDRFLIKSVRKEEMRSLLGVALPKYFEHVEKHPDTLLVRFYGIHRVSSLLGRNARFVVMGNVLPSEIRMHRKYDLKGSTYKRTVGIERRATDPSAVLKDLDLDIQFECREEERARLLRCLKADATFLQRLGVIDYSLLLGVHFSRWGEDLWCPPFQDWPKLDPRKSPQRQPSLLVGDHLAESITGMQLDQMTRSNPHNIDGGKAGESDDISQCAAVVISKANSAREAARLSAAAISSRLVFDRHDGHTNDNSAATLDDDSSSSPMFSANGGGYGRGDLHHLLSRTHSKRWAGRSTGWAMPAVAVRRTASGRVQREPVSLYFGIIDFLQTYNSRKFVEHAWKSTMHGPGVSVADPKLYARRFMECMENLFCVEGSGGSLTNVE